MDFSFSAEQERIREAIAKLCTRFGDDYWLERDREGGFPADFHQALARDGWLGIAMPEAYGGAGLGIAEAAVMMQAISESGAGFSGASAVHMNIFGMNPERILIAAELVGLGRCAVSRAAAYAKERVVFDRPIGKNQAIQHPLAANWMALEAANLMVFKAASLYDAGKPCGAEANAAKYLAGEACFDACQQAVMTHGGFGYAREYHVERYLRESFVGRIAPVTPQLILCFIAERVLGLPKSY